MIGTRHCVVNFELAIFIQNDKVEGATIVFTRNLQFDPKPRSLR